MAPLRERCAELEDEIGALRVERRAEREVVETARRVKKESEAEVLLAAAVSPTAFPAQM